MPKILPLIKKIIPAVKLEKSAGKDSDSQGALFEDRVALRNVKMTIVDIEKRSKILRKLKADNEIAIVGGFYDVTSGVVEFEE